MSTGIVLSTQTRSERDGMDITEVREIQSPTSLPPGYSPPTPNVCMDPPQLSPSSPNPSNSAEGSRSSRGLRNIAQRVRFHRDLPRSNNVPPPRTLPLPITLTIDSLSSTESNQSRKQKVKGLFSEHPRQMFRFFFLLLLLLGMTAGWIVIMVLKPLDRDNDGGGSGGNNSGYYNVRGSLLLNGVFIAAILVILIIFFRSCVYIYRVFHPVPASQHTLPPWLVGQPPPYGRSVGGTGDVEDGMIHLNEGLPKYGDVRGSRLLSRSQSRGGDVRPGEVIEEVAESPARPLSESSGTEAARGVDIVQEEEVGEVERERRLIEETRRFQELADRYGGSDEKARSNQTSARSRQERTQGGSVSSGETVVDNGRQDDQ